MDISGKINKVELNDVESIQTAIKLFSFIPRIEKETMYKRIVTAIKKLGIEITVSLDSPIRKFMQPMGDFGMRGLFNFSKPNRFRSIGRLDTFLQTTDIGILKDDVGFTLIRRMFLSTDTMDEYQMVLIKKHLCEYIQAGNPSKEVLFIVGRVMMGFYNKITISYLEFCKENKSRSSIINSVFIDLLQIANTSQTDEKVKSILECVIDLKKIPFEFICIFYMIQEDLLDEHNVALYKSIKEKISMDFILEIDECCLTIPKNIGQVSLPITSEYIEQSVQYQLSVLMGNDITDIVSGGIKRYNMNQFSLIDNFNLFADVVDKATNSNIVSVLNNKGLDTNIHDGILYALTNSKIIKDILEIKESGMVLGFIKQTCYVICTKDSKVYLVPIQLSGSIDLLDVMDRDEIIPARVIDFRNTSKDDIDNVISILESGNMLEFDKDTNLKFSFKSKNSYMNRYADIHSLLVQNSKNKNYEAMKTDLARMYALIYIIERDVTHSNKAVSASTKSDGNKARMFAKNDMRQYLGEVTKHDKGFDLYKYFNESKVKKDIEDEYHIKINATGVKNLIRSFI